MVFLISNFISYSPSHSLHFSYPSLFSKPWICQPHSYITVSATAVPPVWNNLFLRPLQVLSYSWFKSQRGFPYSSVSRRFPCLSLGTLLPLFSSQHLPIYEIVVLITHSLSLPIRLQNLKKTQCPVHSCSSCSSVLNWIWHMTGIL